MFSLRAQDVRVASASVILAAQLLSSEAGASQVFLNLAPVVGGQIRVSEDSSMTFADAVEGRTGGALRTSTPAESFWVGYQIPTELQHSLSEVNISADWGGPMKDGMSVTFHGVANPAALPPIGETWSAFPSDTHHIVQLASELANGIRYGSFSQSFPCGTCFDLSVHQGRIAARGSEQMMADLIAKEGGLFYMAVTGEIGGVGAFLSIPGVSLALSTDDQNVSVVPLPSAGWLFGPAAIALVGWSGRRRVVPVTSASA
jgi:hypothetical protein